MPSFRSRKSPGTTLELSEMPPLQRPPCASAGFGPRLRAERKRIGLTQEEMGEAAGRNKQTQMRYETNLNSPPAAYLHVLASMGVDIAYVLTGSQAQLQPDEARLLANYRTASAGLRQAVHAVLACCETAQVPGDGASEASAVTSETGHVAKGGLNE